jgi:hypothetical protein
VKIIEPKSKPCAVCGVECEPGAPGFDFVRGRCVDRRGCVDRARQRARTLAEKRQLDLYLAAVDAA